MVTKKIINPSVKGNIENKMDIIPLTLDERYNFLEEERGVMNDIIFELIKSLNTDHIVSAVWFEKIASTKLGVVYQEINSYQGSLRWHKKDYSEDLSGIELIKVLQDSVLNPSSKFLLFQTGKRFKLISVPFLLDININQMVNKINRDENI